MRRSAIVSLLLTLVPVVAFAQEIESLAGVRLVFDRASARSLAIGATGVASRHGDLAAINPAAIAGAPRSLSIEMSDRTIEGRYVADTDLNTIGIESSTRGIHSASLTLPIAGLTWSLFYDQPLDVEHSTASAFGSGARAQFFVCDGRLSATFCERTPLELNIPATFPIDVALQLQRYGAAAAWSRGPVALGASLSHERFRQESVFTQTIAGPPYAGTAESIDDSVLTWGAGLTWDLTSSARIGASYSSGGAFAGARTFVENAAQSIEFRTPPSLGVGVSFDPLPQLTLSADAVRVEYSRMMHDRRSTFPQQSELGFPDVTELHAGAEYRTGKVALRAGWWRDPAHALAILNGVEPPPPFDYVQAIVDSDEDHVTAGIGYGERVRFDAAVDRGARSTRVALGVSTTF